MTDKEQIIIDDMEVLVQSCKFWQEGHCDCYSCIDRYPHCLDFPNCYFKQLARKTQECEELKDTLSKLTQGVVLPLSEPEVINLADRYRKALEEVEGLIQSTLDDFEEDDEEVQLSYCHNISLQILDIISKAKEEE